MTYCNKCYSDLSADGHHDEFMCQQFLSNALHPARYTDRNTLKNIHIPVAGVRASKEDYIVSCGQASHFIDVETWNELRPKNHPDWKDNYEALYVDPELHSAVMITSDEIFDGGLEGFHGPMDPHFCGTISPAKAPKAFCKGNKFNPSQNTVAYSFTWLSKKTHNSVVPSENPNALHINRRIGKMMLHSEPFRVMFFAVDKDFEFSPFSNDTIKSHGPIMNEMETYKIFSYGWNHYVRTSENLPFKQNNDLHLEMMSFVSLSHFWCSKCFYSMSKRSPALIISICPRCNCQVSK